jgi:hypothetical protein
VGYFRRGEEPAPRLWHGSFNSSWLVPPQCEYRSLSLLRGGFRNVKSELNGKRLSTGELNTRAVRTSRPCANMYTQTGQRLRAEAGGSEAGGNYKIR